MRKFSNELYRAFLERAYTLGYTAVEFETVGQPVEFYKGREYICTLMPDGEIHYKDNAAVRDDVFRLSELFSSMKHAYDLYEKAENLPFEGVKNYKVLCEFGNFLLAAMMDNNDQLRFVTWRYSYNRDSVAYGHYFDTDYDGARQDFAVRAGLIDEKKLLKENELVTLYEACIFRGRNDSDISFDDEKRLMNVMNRIQENIPNLSLDCYEQNHEAESELDR